MLRRPGHTDATGTGYNACPLAAAHHVAPARWWTGWRWLLLALGLWLQSVALPVPAQTPSAPAAPDTAAAIARFEAGQDAHQAGQLTVALQLYDEALALDDTLAPIHFQRGMALLALRRTAEAVTAFERCVALQPDFLRGWLQLGAAALAADNTVQAERAYATVLQLAPDHLEARLHLARLALGRQKPEAALEVLAPLGTSAVLPEVDVLRGQALLLAGQTEAAIKAFSHALAGQSNHPEARRGRGDAYAVQGQMEAAVADWQVAYASTPHAELAANIVSALYRLDRPEAARAFLAAARKQFPQDAQLATLASSLGREAAVASAAALLRAGRFAEAAAAYAPCSPKPRGHCAACRTGHGPVQTRPLCRSRPALRPSFATTAGSGGNLLFFSASVMTKWATTDRRWRLTKPFLPAPMAFTTSSKSKKFTFGCPV